MKRTQGTRRHAKAVGLLVCVPVLLIGALPALAWQLADEDLTSDNTEAWAARQRAPRVSYGAPVRITGTTRRPVAPGISAKISLRFVNSASTSVVLQGVRVRIIRIIAPKSDAAHPCVPEDFRIEQMGVRTLQVESGKVTTLPELGVPRSDWPVLTMVNSPVNQDGCKGARLELGYRALGARWP